jgi:hypothetical protein
MSSLTSLQVNQSYQGLLKLADSTSGVTSSLQSVQDGLGNDLPIKVSSTQIGSVNFASYKNFTPDYMGNGTITTGSAPIAGAQTGILATIFYDSGVFDYSAITYNVITASTTSDVVSYGFYTAQWVDGFGLSPHELVFSGTPLDVTPTGFKTTAFASNQSFSGYGSGAYFLVYEIRNSGVTPSIRYANYSNGSSAISQLTQQYGFVINSANTFYTQPWKTVVTGNHGIYYTNLSLQTSYSTSDISSNYSATQLVGQGFLLNVVK